MPRVLYRCNRIEPRSDGAEVAGDIRRVSRYRGLPVSRTAAFSMCGDVEAHLISRVRETTLSLQERDRLTRSRPAEAALQPCAGEGLVDLGSRLGEVPPTFEVKGNDGCIRHSARSFGGLGCGERESVCT